jgi:hypothetical protein
MNAATKITPTPMMNPVGECNWQVHGDEAWLVDEAGVTWHTTWLPGPHDDWAGSIQRHETMGDNW